MAGDTPVTTAAQAQALPARNWLLFGVIVLSLAFAVAPSFIWPGSGVLALALSQLGLLVLVLAVGQQVTGHPLGAFISSQNTVSLSQLQMAIWTIVVISGFTTLVLSRVMLNVEDPLAVKIDPNLWALLGISAASLVGTPLILDGKRRQSPSESVTQRAATVMRLEKVDEHVEGALFVNPSTDNLRLSDLFKGDEVGNAAYVDLGKIQMFVFTALAILVFEAALFGEMSSLQIMVDGKLVARDALPSLSPGLLAILGISHATCLTSKAINHSGSSTGSDS